MTPPAALARLGTVRFRAGMWPKRIAASPDGRKLVTVGHNLSRAEYLTVWDVGTGRPLADGHDEPVGIGDRGFAIKRIGQERRRQPLATSGGADRLPIAGLRRAH